MPQHTENWVGIFSEKILDQHNNPTPEQLFVIDGQYRPTSFFRFFFFFAVLWFYRSLFSSLCLWMSTIKPTEEGTTQPKRNKETTISTTDP